MKTCYACKEDKECKHFSKDYRTKDKLTGICRKCNTFRASQWIKNNRERFNKKCRERGDHKKQSKRDRELVRKYGITGKQYDEILEEQKGVCALCKELRLTGNQKRMHVDHDHKTKKVRGILCQSCNTGLGKFRDDTELLKEAIKYLGENSEQH